MDFINDDKVLDRIVKDMKLNIGMDDHNFLVCELYRHIEYTRRKAYRNGYEQGKFDKEMDLLVENSRPPFRFRSET